MKKFLLFFIIFLVFILSAMGSIESDAQAAVNAAMNFVNGKGFSISPPDYNQGIQVVVGTDGKYYNGGGFVGNLLYVPPALVAKAIHTIRNDPPKPLFPLQADYLDTFLSSFVTVIFGFLLFVINYRIFKLILKEEKAAFLISLIISFSTNLFPLSKHALYHIPYAFFAMWSFYHLLQYLEKNTRKDLIWSGAIMGVSILTYNIVGFLIGFTYAVFLFVVLYFDKKKSIRSIINDLILWSLAILPSVLIFGWFNYTRFSNPLNTGYDPNSYDLVTKGNVLQGLWGQLFSPGRSIFVYSPVLIPITFVAINVFKKNRFSQYYLILFGILVLFYSRLIAWHGELSWGPRYLSILIPFAGIVLASVWKTINKYVLIFFVLIGLFIQLEGASIPYQIQYGPYDSTIINNKVPPDRGSIFDYWSMGEFIPKYSPVNKFKKDVVKRWVMMKDIFLYQNPIDFVHGSSMPILSPGNVFRKHVYSEFYMYAFQPLTIKSLTFDIQAVNQPLKKVRLCVVGGKCVNAVRVEKNGLPTEYTVIFDPAVSVSKGAYMKFLFNDAPFGTKKAYEFDVYGMKYNGTPLQIKTYRRVNTDSSFVQNTPIKIDYGNIDTLWKTRSDIQEVLNLTPDYWWAKTHIYFNLPNVFRDAFYVILGLLAISIIALITLEILDRYKKTYGKKKKR